MLKKIKLILLSAAVVLMFIPVGLLSYRAYFNSKELPVLKLDASKLVKIKGPITDLTKQTKQLTKLVRDGEKIVYIVIDSEGGRTSAGQPLITLIKDIQSQGVVVRCLIDGTAASMSLAIFSSCSERYALFGSKVMWHSAAYNGFFRVNDKDAKTMIERLAVINDDLWESTRLYFWPWFFEKHYNEETMLSVSTIEKNGFGYLRVITNIELNIKNKPVVIIPKFKQ